jgi:Ser/Thr protein kinase RdoA (MazF antagonist)
VALADSFFQLTPERVLAAVEVGGRRATGYALALNSLENRVYEVELEDESRLVVKFYRPARWSREAILAEHAFLRELAEAEVPVVPPLCLDDGLGDGQTLREAATDEGALFYAVFPKVRGRVPEELFDPQLEQIGRLLARLHQVGSAHLAPERPALTPDTYGTASLRLLGDGPWIPPELKSRYVAVGEAIVAACRPAWQELPLQRIHGDCHLGNLVFGITRENPLGSPFFLDFDDFLAGPAVQDVWLLAPGRDEESVQQRLLVVEAYEEMRDFDRRSLRLVEPLRALRILRYAAWIAQRWDDPAFKRTFPQFTDYAFWQREVQTLEELRARVEQALEAPAW